MAYKQYKGNNLARGSEALSLYEKEEMAKLDEHMKVVNQKYVKLPTDLIDYKIGAHPEDWNKAGLG